MNLYWQGFSIVRVKYILMKHIFRNSIGVILLLLFLAIGFSSCYETHYYHRYNHHTRPWYERHHRPVPPGINFELDVHKRR